mmetsp:Transcript_66707/g.134468  ORF Transcript_66707/g.134468 Transcript_66707/m.134468 type:complete len:493 (+) Transcript_66707:65-1543(+)
MPIKDPFGESVSLLSGSSTLPQEQGLSRLFIVSWRVILLVVLACGIAMTYYDRMLLSMGTGLDSTDSLQADGSNAALLTFYSGCILTSLPGARLAEVYGGKLVLVNGILVWAATNIALAFCGNYEAALIPLRGLEGLAQGVIFPVTFHLVSAWFPERERTSAVAASLSGVDLGIYAAMLNLPAFLSSDGSSGDDSEDAAEEGSEDDVLIADLAAKSSYLGMSTWAVHSIVLGVIGLAWCAVAWSLTSSTPEWHPRISLPEVQFITKERRQSMAMLDAGVAALPVNWPLLLRHPSLLAIYATHACASLVFHAFLLTTPLFFQAEYGLSVAAFVPYATLPCAASVTASLLWGLVCDSAITSGRVSRRKVRVRATALGLVIPALAIPALKLCAPNAPLALGVLTVAAVAASVGAKAGWLANVLDVAPNHAGLVMAIASAAAIAPAICVAIVLAASDSATTTALVEGWGVAICGSIILISASALFSIGCADSALDM